MMFREFALYLRGLRRAEITVEKYSIAAKAFVGYLAMRQWTLTSAPRTAVEDFVAWLGTPPDDAGPYTVQLMAYGVGVYLEYLRRRVQGIPEFYRPKLPKLPERVPVALQGPELSRYVQLANREREPYRTALILLPFCGLRISEVCGLTIGDLTFYDYGPGDRRYVITVVGKGNKQRMAPVFTGANGSVSKLVDFYLSDVRPRLTRDDFTPYASRILFPAQRNSGGVSPIRVAKMEEFCSQYREAVGVRITPHKMRSTYLTALLSIGIDISEAARYAGHASIDTIHKHYAGVRIANAEAHMGLIHRAFSHGEVRDEDRQRQQG